MGIASLGMLILPFILYGIFKYQETTKNYQSGRHNRLNRITEGISEMDNSEILSALLVGFIIVIILNYFMYLWQSKVRLVVELETIDSNKEILVTTKSAYDKIRVTNIPYGNLQYKLIADQMDGIGHGEYNCIEISKSGKFIGRIFSEHYTWDSLTYKEILNKIKSIANKG